MADSFALVPLCGRCLAGEGGECHTPGCALWMNRAPDVPVMHICECDDPSCTYEETGRLPEKQLPKKGLDDA